MSHFHRSAAALHSGELADQLKVVKTVHAHNLITCALHHHHHRKTSVVTKLRTHPSIFFSCTEILWTGALHFFHWKLYLRIIISNQSILPVKNCYNKDKNIFTLTTKNQFVVNRMIFWDILQMTYSFQLSFNASSEAARHYMLTRMTKSFFLPIYTGAKIVR